MKIANIEVCQNSRPIIYNGEGIIEQKKLTRIRRGGKIRVMDLFSGCGGISLGFQKAGYSIDCAVEIDKDAASTFGKNFLPEKWNDGPAFDISKFEPEEVFSDCGLEARGCSDTIDVLVGGPPCQAYSRAGRAKLRHLNGVEDAHVKDPRANLYLRYLHYIRKTKPLAILIENVPDSMRFGGVNIPEEIAAALEVEGYHCKYTLLNSVHYGVPQLRDRMFLLALHWVCGKQPEFPDPTNWFELPIGYKEFRSGLTRGIFEKEKKGEVTRFTPSPLPTTSLPKAISAKQAIGDLSPIFALDLDRIGFSSKKMSGEVRYLKKRPSNYAQLMKQWKPFESVRDHIIRWVPRDFPIFRRMNPGDQYPEAHSIAQKIFQERLMALSNNGNEPKKGTAAYRELEKSSIPPYPVNKFPNKWRKLGPTDPARTLLAHLAKDCYSHIHYDSKQARTISIREAARLQSFPDGFQFSGNMGSVFRQIGNSVPPLMAEKIALKIKGLLGV